MKTKLFTLLLAVAASVGTILAWDYERVQIGDLYYNLDATNKTAEVAGYSSATDDIVIPSSVTYKSITYSVTSIGDFAFEYCSSLTSITIPNSVTSIGEGAFYECSGLTSVTIPNSVTSVGDDAFVYCSGLTSPVYNAHVFAYMPTTYSGAYTIPEGIESIAGAAFDNCSGLTSVTIPNSVTSIGYGAFKYCTGLTSITCEAKNPPVCGHDAFEEVPKSIPLYVPFGSEDAYRNATEWKDFTNIQPIKADNVDITTTEVVPDETSVFFHNGQLYILRDGKTYSITGQEVK